MPRKRSAKAEKASKVKSNDEGNKWLKEFTSRNLYRDLCFAFREDRSQKKKTACKGPLRLTRDQFRAAMDEFRARELSRFAIRRGQAYQKRKTDTIVWKKANWAELGDQLEDLRIKMHLARSQEHYRAAEQEFDRIIKDLKPKQRKEHQIKKDPLTFIITLAERLFLWCFLKGEYQAGMSIQDLRRHYEKFTAVSQTRKNNKPLWRGRITGVLWDELEQVQDLTGRDSSNILHITNASRDNALIEICRIYNLTPDSIPVLLSPSRWP